MLVTLANPSLDCPVHLLESQLILSLASVNEEPALRQLCFLFAGSLPPLDYEFRCPFQIISVSRHLDSHSNGLSSTLFCGTLLSDCSTVPRAHLLSYQSALEL